MLKRMFIVFAAIIIAACGGGADNSDPDPSGVWDVTAYTTYGNFTAVLTLTQNGNTNSGTLETSIGSCMPSISFDGTAYQGRLIGSYNVNQIIATIDANFINNQMAGKYLLYSAACGGKLEGGFTAVKRG